MRIISKVKFLYGNENLPSYEEGSILVDDLNNNLYVDLSSNRIKLDKETNDVIVSKESPTENNNIDCWFKIVDPDDELRKEFSECSFNEIQRIVRKGLAPEIWNIGDIHPVVLNGTCSTLAFNNNTYYIKIIGFNQDGENTITLNISGSNAQNLCFIDSFYMNAVNNGETFIMGVTNKGWEDSTLRQYPCQHFYNCLEKDCQNVIKPVEKYSNNNGTITKTLDKIFVPSEFEIFGNNLHGMNESEYCSQYEYYKNSYKTFASQASANAHYYFTRTKDISTTNIYCCGYSNTDQSRQTNNISSGFAPHFVIG